MGESHIVSRENRDFGLGIWGLGLGNWDLGIYPLSLKLKDFVESFIWFLGCWVVQVVFNHLVPCTCILSEV